MRYFIITEMHAIITCRYPHQWSVADPVIRHWSTAVLLYISCTHCMIILLTPIVLYGMIIYHILLLCYFIIDIWYRFMTNILCSRLLELQQHCLRQTYKTCLLYYLYAFVNWCKHLNIFWWLEIPFYSFALTFTSLM